MSFALEPLTELSLDIPATIQQSCWEAAQAASSPRGQWNAYLNRICLETVLPWLQADMAPTAIAVPAVTDVRLELVPGTAISLGDKRLILVPHTTLDTRELLVPQEWVDIPTWAGDYFLGIQVDPDEAHLRVWSYTTHHHLKTLGEYDDRDRAYSLDAFALVTDLSVLGVVQQLAPHEPTQANLAPLPVLSATEAEALLAQLSAPEALNPRLEIPFAQWGVFIANENLLHRLGELRRGSPAEAAVPPITQLQQWLQNVAQVGWQTLEGFLSQAPDLAVNLRQTADLSDATIKRVKLLNVTEQPVLLVVALEPEPDDRVGIRVQLRASNRTVCLAENLTLSLLQRNGGIVQSVQARSHDNIIQLKRFKCAPGTEFRLQVAIANQTHTEDFVV